MKTIIIYHSLTAIKEKMIFLVQTYSVMPGKILKKIHEVLNQKGAVLVGSHRIAMPGSYPLFRKKGITNSQYPTRKEMQRFFDFTVDLWTKISLPKKENNKPVLGIWDYLIPPPKPAKIKKDFGELRLYKDRCTSCRLCKENCPDSAIRMTEYPTFDSSKCTNCFTCYNICTHQAIATTTIDPGVSYSGVSFALQGEL